MAHIPLPNKLYLYGLLSVAVGTGRQTMLARVEEVLADDDICPSDLDCESTRELLESLDDFVRLSVFKRGRVYATVLPQPEWDALLEKADKANKKPAEPARAKAWKRRKGKRDTMPAKPRPKGRPKPVEEAEVVPEPAPVVEAEPAIAAEPVPVVEPEPELVAEPAAEVVAKPAVEPEPEPAPVAEPSITFTITYDPYANEEEVPAPPAEQPMANARPRPATQMRPQSPAGWNAAPSPSAPSPKTSQQELPTSFLCEVSCPNEQLSALYQMLPLDVDPYAILDEDLLVAQSTHALTTQNGATTFPLRFLQEDGGTPITVTLRRTRPTPSGKRWTVTELNAGSPATLEGLPEASESTSRELARFAHIGPWDELLAQLGKVLSADDVLDDADVLQTYVGMTFHRIRCENKLRTYDDGARAAFDTGLTTSSGESILMCLRACEGALPWEFVGFLTPAEAGLSQDPPKPATYVCDLGDVTIPPNADVEVSRALRRAHPDALEPAIRVALRRAERNYRLCTPAYDPSTNRLLLLLPLCLEGGNEASHALALRHTDGGGYCACAVVSLERAATCARVVSLELPRWLQP